MSVITSIFPAPTLQDPTYAATTTTVYSTESSATETPIVLCVPPCVSPSAYNQLKSTQGGLIAVIVVLVITNVVCIVALWLIARRLRKQPNPEERGMPLGPMPHRRRNPRPPSVRSFNTEPSVHSLESEHDWEGGAEVLSDREASQVGSQERSQAGSQAGSQAASRLVSPPASAVSEARSVASRRSGAEARHRDESRLRIPEPIHEGPAAPDRSVVSEGRSAVTRNDFADRQHEDSPRRRNARAEYSDGGFRNSGERIDEESRHSDDETRL